MQIPWNDFKPDDRENLRARIERSLARDIDLTIPPPPPARLPSLWRIVILAAFPVATALAGWQMALRDGRYAAPVAVAMFAWIPILYAFAFIQLARMRRDPQYPGRWRGRRLVSIASK